MMHALRPGPGNPEGEGLDRRPAGSGLPCRKRLFLALSLGSFLSLLFPAAGCLFSTRTPEPPSVNEVPWTEPITAAQALTNVQVTFAAKSVANYNRSLASDFTFFPADADKPSGDPTYFEGWNKQREIEAFTSIFRSTGTVTFIWGPPIPPPEEMLTDQGDPNGGMFYRDLKYRMVFARSGADTTISGLVDLYLRSETGGFSIYRWVDKQDGLGNATLGLVRWKLVVEY